MLLPPADLQVLSTVSNAAGSHGEWYCSGPLETDASASICTNGQQSEWFLVADRPSASEALSPPLLRSADAAGKTDPAAAVQTFKASPSHLVAAGHACVLAALQGAAKADFAGFKKDAAVNAECVSPIGAAVLRTHFLQTEGSPEAAGRLLLMDGVQFDGTQWRQLPDIFFSCDTYDDEPSPPAWASQQPRDDFFSCDTYGDEPSPSASQPQASKEAEVAPSNIPVALSSAAAAPLCAVPNEVH